MEAVTGIVFVEACDDAIAILGYQAVEPFLGSAQPVVLVLQGLGIGAKGVAYIEVAIAQGLFVDTGVNPIPVHAEGTQEYLAVMTAQVTIEPEQALGLEFEEHGVDELDDIVTTKAGQQAIKAEQESDAAYGAWRAGDIDIAGIVLPEVAIGYNGNLVAQCAQTLSQRGMHVTIFSK